MTCRRLHVLALAWAAVGCGPTITLDFEGTDDGTSTGTEVPPAPSTSTRGPGTTTVPPGTTAAPTTGLDSGTTGTSAASSDDIGFIDDPTGCLQQGPQGSSWHCTSFECDPAAQDCPEGEKCMPWANDGGNVWNSARCSPVFDDAVPVGESCLAEGSATSGLDDCVFGAMCWGVDPETNTGTCIQMCDRTDEAACPVPEVCVPFNEGDVPVCVRECDPLDPIACDVDEACRWVEPVMTFTCLPQQGGEILGSGVVCDGTPCDPGEACLEGNAFCGSDCCLPWCDLSDPGADAQCAMVDPNLVCMAFFGGGAPGGLGDLGVCFEAP